MLSAAAWTDPLPDRQIFYKWILVSAARTQLTGWKECRYLYDIASVFHRLVFEHAEEPAP